MCRCYTSHVDGSSRTSTCTLVPNHPSPSPTRPQKLRAARALPSSPSFQFNSSKSLPAPPPSPPWPLSSLHNRSTNTIFLDDESLACPQLSSPPHPPSHALPSPGSSGSAGRWGGGCMTPASGTPTLLLYGRFDGISDHIELDGVFVSRLCGYRRASVCGLEACDGWVEDRAYRACECRA